MERQGVRPGVFATIIGSLFIFATLAGFAVGARDGGGAGATPAPPKMTFAECQRSAEYGNGGQYAVEFDNGVCKVQKP